MRTRTIATGRSDSAVVFALACAAAAAFVGQFAFGTHPAFFLPVGICALPFAASPKRALAYRIAAAGGLILFIAAVGLRQGSLFIPSLAGLGLSVYRAIGGRGHRRGRRR